MPRHRKAERWVQGARDEDPEVDLAQKGLSPGELRSVAARAGGPEALIDRDGKRYVDKGLKYSRRPGRASRRSARDPLLLKTPIVRRGTEATVGFRPEVWELWK